MADIGYYTLPVIVSFRGIDSQVEDKLGKSIQDLGKRTGEKLGTSVIAGMDPTKSTKVDSAIKGSTGAGKKMGDAITTEVAKNIDGKKITDKMSASVQDAVQGSAGKKMGEAVSTTITKNIDTRGLGGKIADGLARVESGEAFKGAGKRIGEHITTGLKTSKIPEQLKEAIDSPLGREIGTMAGQAIGRAIGEQVKDIPGMDKVAEVVEQVAKYGPGARDALGGLRDAVNATKTGDYVGALAGAQTALQNIEPLAGRLGIDLSGLETPLSKLSAAADTKGAIKETTDSLLTLTGSSGKIAGGLSAISAAAGPLGIALAGLQMMPGWTDSLNKVMAGEGGIKDWVHVLDPATGLIDKLAHSVDNLVNSVKGLEPGHEPGAPGTSPALSPDAKIPTVPGQPGLPPLIKPARPTPKGDFDPLGPLPPVPPGRVRATEIPQPGWTKDPKTGTLYTPDGTPVAATPGEYAAPKRDYWSARGAPSPEIAPSSMPAPAAGPGRVPGLAEATTGVANIHASSASISVGSATISGVSVPSYSGTGPGATPVRPGYKSWYDTGGAIPIIAHEGEHVLDRGDVGAMGGQAGVYAFRRALHSGVGSYDNGGEIKDVAAAIAPEVAKAAAAGAAAGAAGAGGKGLGGLGGLQQASGAGGQQDTLQFLTGMLGVAGQGAEETLGLGTVFPDPMANPNVKSLFALASAFKGPIEGAMRGKLGIQQPGWRPGMPVAAMANDQGNAGSIGLPFGLPSIDIPAAPAPGPPETGPAGGPGGPAGPTYNVDASINYHDGSVLGVDPAAQRAADTRTQERNLATTVAPTDPGNH